MGEIESCREFLEKHKGMIRGGVRKALWLMGCTNPEAHSEDVPSEVNRRVIRHWDGFRAPERVIHTIISNAARDHIEECLKQVAQELPDSATPCFVQAGQDPGVSGADYRLCGDDVDVLSFEDKSPRGNVR